MQFRWLCVVSEAQCSSMFYLRLQQKKTNPEVTMFHEDGYKCVIHSRCKVSFLKKKSA